MKNKMREKCLSFLKIIFRNDFFTLLKLTSKMTQTITELIDEGSKKFKYGLLWWFLYPLEEAGGYDYYYSTLLEKSEEEINKELSKAVFIAHYSIVRPGEHLTYFRSILKHLNHSVEKLGYRYFLSSSDYRKMNEVDYLAEFLYWWLTQGNTSTIYISKEMMSSIRHAANRVIRNYSQARMVNTEGIHCMEFIASYYKAKNEKPRFGCGW